MPRGAGLEPERGGRVASAIAAPTTLVESTREVMIWRRFSGV